MKMCEVIYNTEQKIRAHWKFCDALREVGINTSDSKVVNAIRTALDEGAVIRAAFDEYKKTCVDVPLEND